MIKNISILLLAILICGCSTTKKSIVSDSLDAIPVITGSVVNQAAFQKGGSLVLGTFQPGSGAAADDETDQLSSMIIKGINETLPGDHTHFSVSDDPKDSDCVLEGFIETYGSDPKASHMKLRKDQTFLSVDGDIWLRMTGEKIFLFQTSMVIDLKSQNPNTVAYQIGQAVAHYIGSQNIDGK